LNVACANWATTITGKRSHAAPDALQAGGLATGYIAIVFN
jgi:hypothetical protein